MIPRNDLENPMVTRAETDLREPDIICPACGTGWYKRGDGIYESGESAVAEPLSLSEQYCVDCVERKRDDDAQLLAWGETFVTARMLLDYVLDAHIRDRVGAEILVALLREGDNKLYIDWLRGYAQDGYTGGYPYKDWLLART